jgi:heme exporter protein B
LADFFYFLRQDLSRISQAVTYILLVFLSLVITFGVISSPRPDLWQAFLPLLLMGLSYGIMSLSLDSLFREDWEDGTLEWIMSKRESLEIYVLTKILTHWLHLGIPLTVIVGVVSGFSSASLMSGVALTTLSLTLLGATGSALCLMTKNGSFLLPLLTLPLSLPMMIISMGAAMTATNDVTYYMMLQVGLLCMAFAISLIACPFALRLSLR